MCYLGNPRSTYGYVLLDLTKWSKSKIKVVNIGNNDNINMASEALLRGNKIIQQQNVTPVNIEPGTSTIQV